MIKDRSKKKKKLRHLSALTPRSIDKYIYVYLYFFRTRMTLEEELLSVISEIFYLNFYLTPPHH